MKMSFKGVFALFVLCIVTLGLFTASFAQGGGPNEKFFASSERWQFEGTVKVYATLDDALNDVNGQEYVWPKRDGSIYLVKNAPNFYQYDTNAFMVNWYGTLTGYPDTWMAGNQNNQNLGFIQMADYDASNWLNQKAYWQKDKKTFCVIAKGKNATYPSNSNPQDYARLWNAGAPAGSGESTKGNFLKYDYAMTAVFANAATLNGDGIWTNNGQTATSISGHIKGIFQNTSVNYPASNGFYVFDLVITGGNVNWGTASAPLYLRSDGTPNYTGPTFYYPLVPDDFGSSWVKGNN